MAMLSQSFPLTSLECPAGVCRKQTTWSQRSLKALAAGFAAGALAVSGVVMLTGSTAAWDAAPASGAPEASASERAEFLRYQTPRDLPREWRWEIKPVPLDGMFRKRR